MKKTSTFSFVSVLNCLTIALIVAAAMALTGCKKSNNETVLEPLKGPFWMKADTGLVEFNPSTTPIFLNGGNYGFSTQLAESISYPAEARKSDIQGVCKVRFEITETGTVENYEVIQDPGGGIGAESLRALKVILQGTPYKPATLNGKPIRVIYIVSISFKLE